MLLVEDDPDMRQFLTRILGRQHQVEVAWDGRAGLERARALTSVPPPHHVEPSSWSGCLWSSRPIFNHQPPPLGRGL